MHLHSRGSSTVLQYPFNHVVENLICLFLKQYLVEAILDRLKYLVRARNRIHELLRGFEHGNPILVTMMSVDWKRKLTPFLA